MYKGGCKMIDVVKKNYKLWLWLARLSLLVVVTLSSIFTIQSSAILMSEVFLSVDNALKNNVLVYVLFGVLQTVFVELFCRLLLYIVTKGFKIFTLPSNQVIVWLLLCMVIKYALLAGLSGLFFVTPVIYLYNVILEFITTLVACVLFWLVIKKVYLNDKTAPNAFFALAALFAAYMAVNILIGLWGLLL